MVVQLKLHVFVQCSVRLIIYIYEKAGCLNLESNQETGTTQFSTATMHLSLGPCLMFINTVIQYSLPSIASVSRSYTVCMQLRSHFQEKPWKLYTFFLSFFERYTIWVSIDTVYVELKFKIFICLSLNVLLEDFICNVYSFYTYFADLAFQKKYWRRAI